MVDEVAEVSEPTHEVQETQTRTVRGGIIVLLITRTVRDVDGGTIAVKQADCVAVNGDEAGKLVAAFLSGQ